MGKRLIPKDVGITRETREKRTQHVWRKWLGLGTLILAIGGGLYFNRDEVNSSGLPKDKIEKSLDPKPDFGLGLEDFDDMPDEELRDVEEAVDELDGAVRDARERVKTLPRMNEHRTKVESSVDKKNPKATAEMDYLKDFIQKNKLPYDTNNIFVDLDTVNLYYGEVYSLSTKGGSSFGSSTKIRIDNPGLFTVWLPDGSQQQVFGEKNLAILLNDSGGE